MEPLARDLQACIGVTMKAALFGAVVTVTGLALTAPSWAADAGIEITRGSYGYAGDRAMVADALQKLCGGKMSCKFTVLPETFGVPDPSPDNPKGLIVSWKCGATEHKDALVGGKPAELKCP